MEAIPSGLEASASRLESTAGFTIVFGVPRSNLLELLADSLVFEFFCVASLDPKGYQGFMFVDNWSLCNITIYCIIRYSYIGYMYYVF